MNLNTLKYIVTVADERSFTKAAQRLYVSQPLLSQNIQSVENKLGTELFDRKTNPLTITPAGKVYVSWAKSVLLSQMQIEKQLKSISSNNNIRFVVGTSPHRSSFMLPEIIKILIKELPDCDIVIEEGSYHELLEKINRREVDVVIGDACEDTVRYKSIHIANERFILGVPKSYNKLCDAIESNDDDYPSLSLFCLKDKPFIMLAPKYFLGSSFRSICEEEDFTPVYGIECHRVETARALVVQGLGVTLLPEFYIKMTENQPNIDYFTINGRTAFRSISIIYANSTKLSYPAQRFIKIFTNKFKSK